MRAVTSTAAQTSALSIQKRGYLAARRPVITNAAVGASASSPLTSTSAASACDTTKPIIKSLQESDANALQRASVCFGRSMRDDPTMTYATGGHCPERVVALFQQVAAMCMRGARDPATTWLLETPGTSSADSADAVCIACEYPSAYPSDWELLRSGLLRVVLACPGWGALRALLSMLRQFDAAKTQFKKEHAEFLYIACFGTSPEQQGRGLGSQLMRRVLQHADSKDLPVYLEASGTASATFYRRFGFLDLQQVRADPGAPDIYIMARPRASAQQQ